MSAFLVCDVTIKDQQALKKYLDLSQLTLKPFGGEFHVQAGRLEVLEGDWNPEVVIIAEFPSMEMAQQWYKSPAYAPALRVKDEAIHRNMILVDGRI